MANLYYSFHPIGNRSISNLSHKTETEKSKFSFKVHCTPENMHKNREFVANSRVLYYKF